MEHYLNIPRAPVKSANVAQLGYDERTQTLTTQFHDASVYAYHGVPPQINADLQGAASKGKFLREQIRGRFRTTKISA